MSDSHPPGPDGDPHNEQARARHERLQRILARTTRRGPGAPLLPALIGRYVILAELGRGNYGRVFWGFDPEFHRDVAIKVPHTVNVPPAEYEPFVKAVVKQFLREGRTAARLARLEPSA